MIEFPMNSPTVRPAPAKFSDRLEEAFLSEMLKIAMPADRQVPSQAESANRNSRPS